MDPDQRTPANLPAELRIQPVAGKGAAFEGFHSTCQIRDVSGTGLALRVPSVPTPVAQALKQDVGSVEMVVTLESGRQKIEVAGPCVWAHGDSESTAPWKLGMQFGDGTDADPLVSLAARHYHRRPARRAAMVAALLVLPLGGLIAWQLRGSESAANAERVRVLEEQLRETTQTRDEIRKRLTALEEQYQNAKQESEARSDELAKTEQELTALAAEYAAANVRVAELGSSLSSLQSKPPPAVSQAVTHYERGLDLAESGKIVQALSEYREATRLDPELAEAHAELGKLYDLEGNMEAALKAFERYLALRPNSSDAPTIRENIADIREELAE